MQLGYKLIAEGYGPRQIVEQAVRAEQAGFDFVEVSDHFHPWLPESEHSGFAFAMLAAIGERTERIELLTGVTCPTVRYHPAIVAQAAATLGVLTDGRFSLGLGSGERLNEHVVGGGWPSVSVRHEMLREAIEIIRLLWQGGYQSYRGEHFTLDDARVFDLPDDPIRIAVASGGARASRLAAELGDDLFATEPVADLVQGYLDAGGAGRRFAEVPLAYAADPQEAAEHAHRTFRFGLTGWKVQSELPNPVNFGAATSFITPDDVAGMFGCGPDAERHLEVAQQFVDAGHDHLVLINAGPDVDGFFDHVAGGLGDRVRALTPS